MRVENETTIKLEGAPAPSIAKLPSMVFEPAVEDLGRATFETTHERMLRLVDAVRKDELAGRVLLVEHDPVYTAGRATSASELTAAVIPIERGGRVTYHGPGQLVVYPIVRVPDHDLRAWLRALERFGVELCAHFALTAEGSVDGTGVFVAGRKVASIGVAVRHWINFHGIAINVDMDLAAFGAIRPCGLDPSVMTDLSRLLGRTVTLDEAKAAARASLWTLTAAPRVQR